MKQNRYPGAQPFATNQQHIFFGRKETVQQLLQKILSESSVVIHSKSGLGKSSLLNAGILPKIVAARKFQVPTI